MTRRRTVKITHNFDRNLEDIRRFLEEQKAPQAFDGLLEHLFNVLIPNMESFPDLGTDFLGRKPQSAEGRALSESLAQRLGKNTTLREYIFEDYLVLYARRDSYIYLLSIRHHRQLSFDLKSHWVR